MLYALYAEAPGSHHFNAYLASDASIGCMPVIVYGWDESYSTRFSTLPVRVHVSYGANLANNPFVDQVLARHSGGLVLASSFYAGGHIGMIPAAFADAIGFVFAA